MSNESHKIAVLKRDAFGNNASRRLRRAGSIPAVVYGRGKAARAYSVNADEWKSFSQHGAQLVTLLDGAAEIPALVREVQYNHLKNYVVHIDFQEIDLNAEIASKVPVHAHGESYGAAHGGLLEQDLFELEVVCRPQDLPEAVRVDVTKLNIGDSLTVADLVLPQGVRCELDPETLVFHVILPREEAEPEASAEGAAAEPEAINEKKAEARAAEKENQKENK
ncbi:MAG: 50S ribosomal protein L25 [Victivallaceae bacterium]|nr:50S ribosomal protein L25 [Victivallaceae bacterium]